MPLAGKRNKQTVGPRMQVVAPSLVRRPYSIVVVEDNASDVFLLDRALARQGIDFQLTRLSDGAAGLAFIRRQAPYADSPRPDVMLVDLNLPKVNGEALVREIRITPHLNGIPVCVWTSSESLADRDSLNRFGVDSFIFKPSGLEQFMQIGKTLKDVLTRGGGGPIPAFS